MRHGAGYRSVPWDPGEEESSTGGGGGVLDDRVEGARWYKVKHFLSPWRSTPSTFYFGTGSWYLRAVRYDSFTRGV